MKLKLVLGVWLLFTSFIIYPTRYYYIPQGNGKVVRLDDKWRGTLLYYRENPEGGYSFSSRPWKNREKRQKPVLEGVRKKVRWVKWKLLDKPQKK